MDIIKFFEKNFQLKSKKTFRGMQQGYVERTYANINMIKKIGNYKPRTSINEGLKKFLQWFSSYN